MGIDTQKGPLVPRVPLTPTELPLKPWYRRRDQGGPDGSPEPTSLPDWVDIECQPSELAVTRGTRVFFISKGHDGVEVLASDPSPRRLGYVVGPAVKAIARHCISNTAGFSGIIVSDATGERQRVRIGGV